MTFEQVRKLTITALFSDDVLFDQLVLKGGNAMRLVHGIGARVSLDLDFSLEGDFQDLADTRRRMERALTDRFAPAGFAPFDLKFTPKPSLRKEQALPRWGGYQLEFKLVESPRDRSPLTERERLRREALVIGPNQKRVFTVDFSKWEYTGEKVRAELDDYTIYVYTPAMIALEKLRAICQQMEEYTPIGRSRRPRARDFYDIHAIVTNTAFRFDSPAAVDSLKLIFAAKEVSLSLLGKIREQREFHRPDWPDVVTSVAASLPPFDFYFDFLLGEIEPLHTLWME